MATQPSSTISPSITVSIPISRSLAINFIVLFSASITRHSNIAIVDLLGIAFNTILIPSSNLFLSQMMFIVYNSLQSVIGEKNIK